MRIHSRVLTVTICAWLAATAPAKFAQAAEFWPFVLPEQRSLCIRDPSQLPQARVPDIPPPPTVSDVQRSQGRLELAPRPMSLDEAVRIALGNCQVVRVLAGLTAASSGVTIYDPAISNTGIDQEQARFDPTLEVDNSWNRVEEPGADFLDPLDPALGSQITGLRTDAYDMGAGLNKTTLSGGTLGFGVAANPSRFQPGVFPLNPRTPSSLDLSFRQPLLQGGGFRANLSPIVVARIDTERSYFQLKDAVQELVRGVVQAYWAVVSARTDVWARRNQVEQSRFANELTKAQQQIGAADAGDAAQTRVAWSNFRADLIAAEADLIQREAALRNILGLPPSDGMEIVPVTPPETERLEVGWYEILELAEQRRSDIIELKLILEADQQLVLQARNQALPQLDGVAIYRWNGLEGEMRNGLDLSSRPGQFTDWSLGVNFSVPLSLRRERAALRRRELIVARDRANLQQGLHSASHVLAASVRNLARFYEQYDVFKETRAAASTNLDLQVVRYRISFEEEGGRESQYLNLLLAITDWGNAISSEAATLLQYNTELANLERQTGTILETHGIRFYEERYAAIGPLGRAYPRQCYPSAAPPSQNTDQYRSTPAPAEEFFELKDPLEQLRNKRRRLEPPPPMNQSSEEAEIAPPRQG